jgi:hypothetical protein
MKGMVSGRNHLSQIGRPTDLLSYAIRPDAICSKRKVVKTIDVVL